jgi:hypothetical protein
MKPLNTVMVRNVEVILEQTLNHSAQNSVILYNAIILLKYLFLFVRLYVPPLKTSEPNGSRFLQHFFLN